MFNFDNEPDKKNVVVKNFPYEKSAKSILSIMRNGGYHYSNGLADNTPFSSYIAVSSDEIKDYVDKNGSPDIKSRERYAYKKRRIFLDQFIALKTLGFAKQASKTSNASYTLTDYGKKMVQGLSIMEEAEKLGLSYEDILNKIKNS